MTGQSRAPDTGRRDEAPFFPVSGTKLLALSVFSFGAYELYWSYENWRRVHARAGLRLGPLGCAILAPLSSYALFRRVKNFGLAAAVPTSLSPGLLAAAYLALVASSALRGLGWLALALTCLPLLPIRSATERINLRVAPEAGRNERFSLANWLLVATGALVWLLILAGALARRLP